MDEQRIASVSGQTVDLVRREQATAAEREGLGEELAAAGLREAALRAELDELRSAAAVARSRLADAETAAGRARERLRSTQDRMRAAEVAELEARLAIDSIRDQVLVELAGLGELGVQLLVDEIGDDLASARGRPDGRPAGRARSLAGDNPSGGLAELDAEDADSSDAESQNSELEKLLNAAGYP
jgi:hypothetical protein